MEQTDDTTLLLYTTGMNQFVLALQPNMYVYVKSTFFFLKKNRKHISFALFVLM